MTHRLYLLRHAKSAWDDPALDDHDRPLTPRGERAAVTIGQYMQQQGLLPDLVLCSSARRARDTWALVESRLKVQPMLLVESGLYLAGARAVLERLRTVEESVPAVLLIGHNPDLHQLARSVAGSGDARHLADLKEKFPTCALAALGFAGTWAELRDGAARLTRFVTPKALV